MIDEISELLFRKKQHLKLDLPASRLYLDAY